MNFQKMSRHFSVVKVKSNKYNITEIWTPLCSHKGIFQETHLCAQFVSVI